MPQFSRIVRPSWNQECWFVPGTRLPGDCAELPRAVLVFAFWNDRFALADIRGRGLTVPSGHIDPGETAPEAAVRETFEETGGIIAPGSLRHIGFHAFTPLTGDRRGRAYFFPAYVAQIERFASLPDDSESEGCVIVRAEDLATRYFLWDDLARELFEFAANERVIQS